MEDERFEWRDAKAVENFRDHGVTFDKAVKAFSDPFAIEWIDQSEAYGVERWNMLHVQWHDPARDLHGTRGADQNYFGPAGGAP